MAMLRGDSDRGKKRYPIGSPEWVQEQIKSVGQENIQRMLDEQKQAGLKFTEQPEANPLPQRVEPVMPIQDARPRHTGYAEPEIIPLPSGDTATQNPVDVAPVTYEPDFEELEREELRKSDPAPYSIFTDNVKKYIEQGFDKDKSKTKAALDAVSNNGSTDSEINNHVLDYFDGNTNNPSTKKYLSEIKEQMNNPNMNVIMTGYIHKELDEKDAIIETNKVKTEYGYYLTGLSIFAGPLLGGTAATQIGMSTAMEAGSMGLLALLPDVLPGTYDTIKVQLYNNDGEDSGSYNITIGPEGSLLVRNDYVRGTNYYTNSRTESPYKYDPVNGLTHK